MSNVGQGMARDLSIASLTGASQALLGLNGNRQFLLIQNIGSANIGVNLTGGAAAIGSAGTITLAPGGSLIFALWVPQGAVAVIGTAAQAVTAIEG